MVKGEEEERKKGTSKGRMDEDESKGTEGITLI